MSKLGVLLTICLLLFPLTALPMDGDQPVDRLAERMQDNISSEQHTFFEKRLPSCCSLNLRLCPVPACKRNPCCTG
uniref:Kappa-conotoxin RIIIK n=2 Tax=Conus radiatus TaxID=61198 RepID=CM3K_CONRA|nr:RecName: Full=Kappa-conotoxin RIIIK; Short=Kappa-M-RIIIK; AltName: Full=Conotoxin R3.1; Flags: Precursor [Conus radiatus]